MKSFMSWGSLFGVFICLIVGLASNSAELGVLMAICPKVKKHFDKCFLETTISLIQGNCKALKTLVHLNL